MEFTPDIRAKATKNVALRLSATIAAMKRNGLDLIIEKVEDDAVLVELLDHDVTLGQGYLFGAPRRSDPDEGKALD